jgi:kinesin family protein C2/C3
VWVAESQHLSFVTPTTVQVSVLEIYNERIYDLLAAAGGGGGGGGSREQSPPLLPPSEQAADRLDVKAAPDGNGMHVPGLKMERVASSEDVAALLAAAARNRSSFATNMNEHSSRSHLVLSVYVTAAPRAGGCGAGVLRGKLHLVDLAGSERVGRSGVQGERLKEAQAINKSLSALGDVIAALQQRAPHVPFRNSKVSVCA